MFLETLYPKTKKLFDQLTQFAPLNGFRLVGGTALALQLGHRKSIDLDFFNPEKVDLESLRTAFENSFKTEIVQSFPAGLLMMVDGVKVDIIRHNYPWLQEPLNYNTLQIAQLKDISAMKVNAICGRGSKKDFFDIYFLLQYFSINEIAEFFVKKYANYNPMMVLKSLAYFQDAEEDPHPDMLKKVSWEKVKATLLAETKKL